MSWLVALAVGTLLDLAYTRWVQHTGQQRALHAAAYSMLIGVMSLTGIVLVVEQREFAVPYVLGLGLGSFLGVKWR